MNENDVIAEYVKERYPELLDTLSFSMFRLRKAAEKCGNELKKCFENINLLKILAESQDEHEIQEGEQNEI